MSANINEAVALLTDAGVIGRLKDEAQAAREAQRETILGKLEAVERQEAEAGAIHAAGRQAAEERIARLERELAEARRERNGFEYWLPCTAENMRGQLRRLADPAIEKAIYKLRDMESRARNAFSSGTEVIRTVSGTARREVSNSLEIADALAAINAAWKALEALQESLRPDDLTAAIDAVLEPAKLACRGVRGLHWID